MPRIAPAEAPYPPAIAAELQRIMPKGVEPLVLFRTLARSPRIFEKMFAGGLLDKGPLSLRQREIVIDRTTARLGCEYEWGVHIAFFAAKVGFDPERVAATVTGPADAACWTAAEQALLALVDDFVDRHTLSDTTWSQLTTYFDEAQILEAIALVGYYHTISFLCRGLKLPLESYSALRAVAAGDAAALLAAQRGFQQALRKHIADIRDKYIVPGETAESALMFLPSEAVYAELHANFTGLVEESYRARVWIVSPTTMMATLNTVRAVLKDVRMREQAGEIQKMVGQILGDVKRLDERVDNLKKHFTQTEKDLREIDISATQITKRGQRILDVDLGEEPAALPPPRV